MSTNIITVRKYPDASIGVSINGREIPDCRVAVRDSQSGDVYIKIGCGSFTELDGDERTDTPFVDPELAELRGDIDPQLLNRIANLKTTLVERKKPWYVRFVRWIGGAR